MPKLIIPPYRLQTGTTYDQSLPMVNDNFELVAGAFNGFATSSQPPFEFGFGGSIPASGLEMATLPLYGNDATESVLVAQPKLSLYIDSPLDADGFFVLAPAYLFPTGSTITGDRLAMMVTTYCQFSPPTEEEYGFWTYTDGDTGILYYPVAMMAIIVRNAGVSTHSYFIRIDGSVYTTGNSQFR